MSPAALCSGLWEGKNTHGITAYHDGIYLQQSMTIRILTMKNEVKELQSLRTPDSLLPVKRRHTKGEGDTWFLSSFSSACEKELHAKVSDNLLWCIQEIPNITLAVLRYIEMHTKGGRLDTCFLGSSSWGSLPADHNYQEINTLITLRNSFRTIASLFSATRRQTMERGLSSLRLSLQHLIVAPFVCQRGLYYKISDEILLRS